MSRAYWLYLSDQTTRRLHGLVSEHKDQVTGWLCSCLTKMRTQWLHGLVFDYDEQGTQRLHRLVFDYDEQGTQRLHRLVFDYDEQGTQWLHGLVFDYNEQGTQWLDWCSWRRCSWPAWASHGAGAVLTPWHRKCPDLYWTLPMRRCNRKPTVKRWVLRVVLMDFLTFGTFTWGEFSAWCFLPFRPLRNGYIIVTWLAVVIVWCCCFLFCF